VVFRSNDKEHHPGGVHKEASRHFLGDAATPPRGDARRGIRFFQNDTSKPHIVFLAALDAQLCLVRGVAASNDRPES
jgi:hypothetical protein